MERESQLSICALDYARLWLRGTPVEQLIEWAARGDWTQAAGAPSAGDRAFAFAVALFFNPSSTSNRDRLLAPYAAKDLASALTPKRSESLRRVVTSARVTARGLVKPAAQVVAEDFARIRIRARSLARHLGESQVFTGFPTHGCYAAIDRLEDDYAGCDRMSEAYFEYLDCILDVFAKALHLDFALIELSETDYCALVPYLDINLQLARSATIAERFDTASWNNIEGQILRPRSTLG